MTPSQESIVNYLTANLKLTGREVVKHANVTTTKYGDVWLQLEYGANGDEGSRLSLVRSYWLIAVTPHGKATAYTAPKYAERHADKFDRLRFTNICSFV